MDIKYIIFPEVPEFLKVFYPFIARDNDNTPVKRTELKPFCHIISIHQKG